MSDVDTTNLAHQITDRISGIIRIEQVVAVSETITVGWS